VNGEVAPKAALAGGAPEACVSPHDPRLSLRCARERHCLDHRAYAREHAEGECVLRINRRAGGVTHDAAARANQLQRRDLDRLSIDAYYDKPAAHCEPRDMNNFGFWVAGTITP
jgi:hypothetical protein